MINPVRKNKDLPSPSSRASTPPPKGGLSNGVKCPLCSYEFEEENAKKPCEACGASKGCSNILCCPNCDYHLPTKSKVVEFIAGLFRRKKDEARRD